jgi:hypothetical protein
MSIQDNFPKPELKPPSKLLQAHVEMSLYKSLIKKLKEKEVSTRDFVEAAIRTFLQEK